MILKLLARTKTITGTIIDETGEPMIGVSVLVQGTTTGAVTDLDGKFALEVPANATLVVFYIGYKTQNKKSVAKIRLPLKWRVIMRCLMKW